LPDGQAERARITASDEGVKMMLIAASCSAWRAAHCTASAPGFKVVQDHSGRPIIVRCIPAGAALRAVLTGDVLSEGPMSARAGLLFTGTTVAIMARTPRRKRR
jgi:hypothetical protein